MLQLPRWTYPEPHHHTVSAKNKASLVCWWMRVVPAPLLWVMETHFCTIPERVRWGTPIRSNDLGIIKLLYDVTADSPYLWTWGPKLPGSWSGSAAHLCISQLLNHLLGKTVRKQCPRIHRNRYSTWKKAFFGPSPVISEQIHWEKLVLGWTPGHKPSQEEHGKGLAHSL